MGRTPYTTKRQSMDKTCNGMDTEDGEKISRETIRSLAKGVNIVESNRMERGDRE